MSEPVLRVRLDAGYGNQLLVRDLRFELAAGERLGLLGSSGAGKSTLVLALLGLLPQRGGWARGEVLLAGRNLLHEPERKARSLRGRVLALVPQSPVAALNPALSLHQHFKSAWGAHCPSDSKGLDRRMRELLEQVALPATAEFLKRKGGQISVGQAQRCTLALALLHRPRVLLADEPTSALDPATQVEVLQLLRDASEHSGTALLFVSHDLLSVLRLCHEVAVLSGGSLGERLAVGEVARATDPTLQRLLGTLPVPVDILLRHLRSMAGNGTEVFNKGALPTPLS